MAFQAFRYDVVAEFHLSKLVERVNTLLGQGAKPIGGVSCMPQTENSHERYFQAMAIPSLPNTKKVSVEEIDVPHN